MVIRVTDPRVKYRTCRKYAFAIFFERRGYPRCNVTPWKCLTKRIHRNAEPPFAIVGPQYHSGNGHADQEGQVSGHFFMGPNRYFRPFEGGLGECPTPLWRADLTDTAMPNFNLFYMLPWVLCKYLQRAFFAMGELLESGRLSC